jgi:hypothetical protein
VRLATVLTLALVTPGWAWAQPAPVLAIEGPDSLAAARTRVERIEPRTLVAIVRVVGLDAPGAAVRVVLAEEGGTWAEPVPSWAAGYAVGEADLVVLFPSRSPMYPHDTLEDVLRHEVAHVLVSRAAGGQQVPRWFHEGLAVAVERPWDLEDRARLASTLLFGPRLGLAAIDSLFLGDEAAQQRAYLLSTALVHHLMRAYGGEAPARVLKEVARGRPFELAMASVTAQSLPRFEEAFWRSQRTWTTWVPFIASSTVLWLGVIGLSALAVRRRRQRSKKIRRDWANEEVAVELDEPEAEGPKDLTRREPRT